MSSKATLTPTEVVSHYVGGNVVSCTSARVGTVYNPAVGKESRRVAFASKTRADHAVDVATASIPAWTAQPRLRREPILNNFRDLLERDLVCIEGSRPKSSETGDVDPASKFCGLGEESISTSGSAPCGPLLQLPLALPRMNRTTATTRTGQGELTFLLRPSRISNTGR
jgi:hypothetical protein